MLTISLNAPAHPNQNTSFRPRPFLNGNSANAPISYGPNDSLMLSRFAVIMNQMMRFVQSFQGHQAMSLQQTTPLQSFLGQGPNFGGPQSSPRSAAQVASSASIPGASRGGNIDVGRLIQALPANRRRSAQRHFPVIIQEAQRQGIRNRAQLAYILATATHESGAGAFMEEFASGRAYEGREDLGNSQRGDGVRFKGRGYVQLTGRRNYRDWSRRLGIDIVSNPDRVKEPRIAARILVEGMMRGTFTGQGLGSHINERQTDFVGARRTVNGNDRAHHIAGIAQQLLGAMS